MIKPDFGKCVTEATKLLYNQDTFCQTLDVKTLRYDKNIVFDSIQNYASFSNAPIEFFFSDKKKALKDGCTIVYGNIYIVLFNNELTNKKRLNWTLAHEIGHIHLGHTKDEDIEEVEAHFFASQLLMPEYTIHMIGVERGKVTSDDLVELFGVSDESARKRIKTMNKKSGVSYSNIDIEIWKSQKEKVDIYFDCKKSGHDFRDALIYVKEMKEEQEREYFSEMVSLYH